jgi:hypothetical protein
MSTNREKFLKQHGLPKDTSLSLLEIANTAKVQYKAVEEVYRRGVGAHQTNPESVRVRGTFVKDPSVPISQKLSAQQWGYARVYAFVMRTKSVYFGADDDIRRKYGLE